jgi:hypothetical protein
MRSPVLRIAIISIIGSFVIHCTQSALPSLDGTGEPAFEDDSKADGTTPATFTKLLGPWYLENDWSPRISVAGYREVVVYSRYGCSKILARFSSEEPTSEGDESFGYTGQELEKGGRLRVDGPYLRIGLACGNDHIQVAGVR